MRDRHFEDIEVGERRAGGRYEVTKSAIVDFAEQFDPQPFHVDEEAAAESMFGGLVASGWHTGAIAMRLLHDVYMEDVAVLGALGVDDLRWVNPVRPGDTLTHEVEIVDKEDWKPGVGLVHVESTTSTTDGTVVLTQTARALVDRRQDG
ncbi:MaoC family dehydratase [Halobacteriales archaeon Cl-PHB]